MAEFLWSDDYSVGDGTIDNDHRGLFAAVNELEQAVTTKANNTEIERIVVYLVRYVNEHFQREERLMRDCGYPDFDEHQDRHKRFSQKIFAVEQIFKSEPDSLNLDEMVEFLRGWLVRHILGADQDFSPFIKGHAVGDRAPQSDTDIEPKSINMVSVDLRVPNDKVAILRQCAEVLSRDDASCDSLVAMVERSHIPDLAQAKLLVEDLLR
jgi:hemerythrin